AAHQRRLDLVVAENMAAQDALAAERRDRAVRPEGCDAEDRVVAPVGPAVGLPPGAADGPGAQAETHAELEQPREGAAGRHADHQALQDAELGRALHDP